MKKFIKSHKKDIIVLSCLGVLFLLTRLPFLLKIPLFTDEAIYIYWAKFMGTYHSNWLISITDGKPPLLIWMMLPLLAIFPENMYLLAGRLPSVVAGLSSVVALYFLAQLLFKNRISGFLASLLYIVVPYTLMYDRLALFDSLLTSMLIWTLYFGLKAAFTRKLVFALLWGIFLALAMLSKATALMYFVLVPFSICVLTYKKDLQKYWKKYALFSILAVCMGYAFDLAVRIIFPGLYTMYQQKNSQFQLPVPELLQDPLQLTTGNMGAFFNWTIPYVTISVMIAALIGFIILCKKNLRVAIILFTFYIVPALGLATIGRIIFPRYFLITVPFVILPAAYALSLLFTKKSMQYLGALAVVLVLIPALYFDYKLLTNPANAPIPVGDKTQYITDHPSGYGLEEVYEYINNEAEKGKITVVTQGTFGLYPYAFDLEYWQNPQVTIVPRWPLDVIDQPIYDARKNSEVLFIFKEKTGIPESLPIREVLRVKKPGARDDIVVGKFKD